MWFSNQHYDVLEIVILKFGLLKKHKAFIAQNNTFHIHISQIPKLQQKK